MPCFGLSRAGVAELLGFSWAWVGQGVVVPIETTPRMDRVRPFRRPGRERLGLLDPALPEPFTPRSHDGGTFDNLPAKVLFLTEKAAPAETLL